MWKWYMSTIWKNFGTLVIGAFLPLSVSGFMVFAHSRSGPLRLE